MIRLTVCNHKGGTGKTTSSVHIAAALGLSGYRTLVVDLDPQGFLSRMLGVSQTADSASSLILFDLETPADAIEPLELPHFDLLPSSKRLTNLMRRLNKPTDVLRIREKVEEEAWDYDVVLFDTAAAITVYSLNALVASEDVLIPVTPEYQPVVGAEQTYRTVEMVQSKLNPDLRPPSFLFTQVDARKRNHKMYRNYLRDRYKELILDSIVRTSTALASSYGDGGTVFDHEPYSRGARDYANVTDELLQRLNETSEYAESAPASQPLATPDRQTLLSGQTTMGG